MSAEKLNKKVMKAIPETRHEASPYLSSPYPTPEMIRRHLELAKQYTMRNNERSWTVKGVKQRMANIYPDAQGRSGSYPIPIEPIDPTDEDMADPIRKMKAESKWRASFKEAEWQSRYIETQRGVQAAMLKGSLSEGIKDTMRKSESGRQALESLDDPLDIINVLIATDFSRDSLLAIDPVERFCLHLNKYNDKEQTRQGPHESLEDWRKRFNSEVAKLEILAKDAGKETQVPDESLRALHFYQKLNNNYTDLRKRFDTGLASKKPTTVDGVVELAKFYDRKTTSQQFNNNGSTPPTSDNQQRGVFKTTTSSGGNDTHKKEKERFRCYTHHTNEHRWNDEECKRLQAENKTQDLKKSTKGSGNNVGGKKGPDKSS